MKKIFRFRSILLVLGFALAGACQLIHPPLATVSYPQDPLAVKFSGIGAKNIPLQGLSGPVIVHVIADKGKAPFQVVFRSAQGDQTLVSGPIPLDEYRGYEIDPNKPVILLAQGDQSWSVTISPPDPKYFFSLKIPGKYTGSGNAVIFLDGEYGVATFQLDATKAFHAWAYGARGVAQELYITPAGDYKGKSVLPIGAGWVIVSAKGEWSVDIEAPCCKAPPGYKPTYQP